MLQTLESFSPIQYPNQLNPPASIIVFGTGNTLRGDDGIGAYICQAIEKHQITGVETRQVTQLNTDLLDEMIKADHIILADASSTVVSVSFYPVSEDESSAVSSSHHMSAGLLAKTALLLYQKRLSLFVCAVRGYDFSLQEGLTENAKKNADQAVSIIINTIHTLSL